MANFTDPTLIVVRHGSTDFNSPDTPDKPEKIRGWIDVPLNAAGRKEAIRIAEALKPYRIVKIYTSDLHRTVDTAKTIQQAQKGKVQIIASKEFRPWNLGQWQGMPVNEVRRQMKDLQLKHPEKPAPGGESYRTFLRRFLDDIAEVLGEVKRLGARGIIVLVTHTRDQHALQAWIEAGGSSYKVDQKVLEQDELMKTGEAMTVSWDGKKWSSHSFLEGKPSTEE